MMLTHEEMRALDINAKYFGTPAEVLMENAGRAVAEEVLKRFEPGCRVVVLCGHGNNGGDGLVAARYLANAGARVRVYLVRQPATPLAAEMLGRLRSTGRAKVLPYRGRIPGAEVLVDALLGTGVRGEVREPYRSVISQINRSGGYVVSVDVPSGMNEEGGGYRVEPELVVTFHALKHGLQGMRCVVRDIGVPEEAERYAGPGDVAVSIWKRRRESHKGENGRVLVVGGSAEYHGAPLLAALGALRAGADIVTLAVPEVLEAPLRAASPEVILRPYQGERLTPEAAEEVAGLAEAADCVLLGPGLGEREETLQGVRRLLEAVERPCVVDASALAGVRELPSKSVLTPHAGEFRKLTGREVPGEADARAKAAQRLAGELNATVLLKGAVDVVASPERVKLNRTGNPGMTKGGTGDVLAGVVAGFMAQGCGSFPSACCAAFLCGLAGDMLQEEKGYGFSASEVADALPLAVRRSLEFC